jgi:GNAT superfamily N-acetyltransferase
VNVRDVEEAIVVLRRAAHQTPPFSIELGPMATFLPHNPVAYLAVGAGAEAVHALRDRVFHPPLERDLSWPFVPHVTVADGIDPERIAAAPAVLGEFRRPVALRSVTLLTEEGHRWRPVTTVPLGSPAVIGRGGLPLEIEVLDDPPTVVVSARRDGEVVAGASGWRHGDRAWLATLDVREHRRRDGIGSHVLAAFESWAAQHDAVALEVDPALALDDTAVAFLTARGWASGARHWKPLARS